MCGRFVRTSAQDALIREFGVDAIAAVDLRPRYNICPGEHVAAIIADGREKRVCSLRWGFLPPVERDGPSTVRAINARAETVAAKPAFRAAFRQRRCLIVADGFYEWMQLRSTRVPYFIHLRSNRPLAFAGLWERGTRPQGQPLYTCTILTCPANTLLSAMHDRMPAILSPVDREAWLEPGVDAAALRKLLKPYAWSKMEAYRVSTLVNSPRNDSENCIRRLP